MDFTTLKKILATVPKETAIFACDVHRDQIELYTRMNGEDIHRSIKNGTRSIMSSLEELAGEAKNAGVVRIVLVAEPTGVYHMTLMRCAEKVGITAAWLTAEHVSKMRVIESNDTGKTDTKDPCVIHTLAQVGKILQYRTLQEPYSLLREWNPIYEEADSKVVEAKCSIHAHIRKLFPDFGFKKDFPFGNSGRVLAKLYGHNPYRICRAGKKRFSARMKKAAPHIHNGTLDRLYAYAQISVKNELPERQTAILERRIHQLYEDLELNEKRKQEAKAAMEALYHEARGQDSKLPQGRQGVITTFHLSRVTAETGPLSDFSEVRQVLRFAGLNLRERKSGKYRGKTRISKKGRILLRKIAGQIVLPLVKEGRLYADYYRKVKKACGSGTKALTAVSRHFLKMLFGWYKSGLDFDEQRVFTSESQFLKAA